MMLATAATTSVGGFLFLLRSVIQTQNPPIPDPPASGRNYTIDNGPKRRT
jgi:hypothetical protein